MSLQAVVYYITLPFVYLISALPLRMMYALSDFIFVVIYHIIRYRKSVVLSNLRNSFPEKSEKEIRTTCRKFYRHFCDLMLETLKTLTATPSDIRDMIEMIDDGALQHYFEKKQSLVLVLGHYGNWEIAGALFSQNNYHQLYVIYHPLVNPYFDKLLYHMRTRSGTRLYAMKEAFKGMVRNRKDVTCTSFIADQTPSPRNACWLTFLNQETPVSQGTEKIAKKLNYPVVYASIKKPQRGQYKIITEVLCDHSASTDDGEISKLHTKRLERDICEQPEIWLWTHKRWKHNRPEDVSLH